MLESPDYPGWIIGIITHPCKCMLGLLLRSFTRKDLGINLCENTGNKLEWTEEKFIVVVDCPGCRMNGLLGDVLLDDACLHNWRNCLCRDTTGKGIGIVHCSI